MAIARWREEPPVFGGDGLPFPLPLGDHFRHLARDHTQGLSATTPRSKSNATTCSIYFIAIPIGT